MTSPAAIRQPCPPAACTCGHEQLLASADPGQQRILQLTRHEERKLIERLDALQSFEDLQRLCARMHELLGIRVRINPSHNEVRSVRGLVIEFDDQPGLCRKTRDTIPAAIRRALVRRPEIFFRLLDEHDLLRGA
ncbi:hypothetical protein PMM47T1_08516 [Pseudomonas sp. M47T1]|uniref:hypothetical protein n=1 Tax=unclassified Pseudomonas TaxID=196821 RepID=UPI0002607D3A|nr:hypothetical protein [Pseudomonas sp. M47T1]EIK97171.1 hypothetical protein PMM47T1_08516 [Pseudomonas sp. M47T1]